MSLSRRAALGAGLGAIGAALLGGVDSVNAKSGEGAKLSIFGVGGQSSPFTSGIETGGTVQYTPFSEDEMKYFRNIVDSSRDRLEAAKPSIDAKSWEDIRSSIRLEMYNIRKTAVELNANISDDKTRSNAEKLYAQFKQDVNDLDYACVTKNQDKALKSYKSTLKSLSSWREVVGI